MKNLRVKLAFSSIDCCQYMRCSSETDWVNIILAMIFKELYKSYYILHITTVYSPLHTLLKDKCMCLQDE